MSKKIDPNSSDDIKSAIASACQAQFGVLDANFLCRSVSALNPKNPFIVNESASIEDVISLLSKNKIGCILICDSNEKVKGIFTERDLLLKVVSQKVPFDKPILDFMTKDPMSIEPNETIAFALNLMSHGGFRHLPVVDQTGSAIGIISVKDVIDYIVNKMTEDLLNL